MDLINEGTLTFVQCQFDTFVGQKEENDYFYFFNGKLGGYFKGLNHLTTKERQHFEKNVDVYLYYNRMTRDTTILQKEKDANEWSVERFRRLLQ